MKVVCEYCGSYVEADENMKCPLCCAELGSAVRTEQSRLAKVEEAERQYEAEVAAQEAKDDHISEIIQGVTNVATAIAAGKTVSQSPNERRPMEEPADTERKHRERPPRDKGERSGMGQTIFGSRTTEHNRQAGKNRERPMDGMHGDKQHMPGGHTHGNRGDSGRAPSNHR